MVGAMADWFAVTALFRHPLGLPIPHTALIPGRKDELGQGLQDFVGENFLQEEIIRERVGAAPVTQRVATWAASPRTPAGWSRRSPTSPRSGWARCRTGTSRSSSRRCWCRGSGTSPSPLLGRFVTEAVRDDLHHGVVDLALEELHGWLRATGHLHRDAQRAGARGGRRRGSTRRSPRGCTPRRSGGSPTSAPTPTTTRGPRWTRCWPSSARTCCTRRRPRPGPRGSSCGCWSTRSSRRRGLAVAGAAQRAARRCRTRRPLAERLERELVALAERLLDDADAGEARPCSATSWCSRCRATAPS